MKQEYQDNAIVKSLLLAGFSEDYIEKSIESGDIKIEKSKSEKEMDRSERFEKENVKNDEKHIKDLEKDKKEDKEDVKDLERDKKAHEEKKDDIEKGFTPDLMKSLGDTIGNTVAAAMAPFFKGINEQLKSHDELLKSMSSQAPDFRSTGISASSILEKSLEKDEAGKTSLNVVTQRPLVKSLIERDEELLKSFGDDVKDYLMYPEATSIGEGAARYMFEKMNIKLVR